MLDLKNIRVNSGDCAEFSWRTLVLPQGHLLQTGQVCLIHMDGQEREGEAGEGGETISQRWDGTTSPLKGSWNVQEL